MRVVVERDRPRLSRARRWLLRGTLIGVALVALYAAAGAWLLPRLLRTQLETTLTELTLRPARVRAVEFRPFDLRLEIGGLEVADHDAPRLFAFERLVVDVAGLALLRGDIAFEEIRLVRPFVRLTLERGGRLNVSDVLDAQAARSAAAAPEPPAPPTSADPPAVRIALLEIEDGALEFLDRSRPTPFATTLAPLAITLTDFSTERDRNSPYAFEARFDERTRLAWKGDFSVNPLRSSGELRLEGLRLQSFAPYLEGATQLVLTQGALGIAARYDFDGTSARPAVRVSDGRVTVEALSIAPPGGGAPVLGLGRLSVGDIAVDLGARTVSTGSIALDRPEVVLSRSAAGVIDLAAWSAPPTRSATVAPRADDARAAAPAGTSTTAAPPWSVRVAGLGLRDGALRFTDHGTPLAVAVDELRLDTGPLTVPLPETVPARLALRIDRTARLTVDGAVPLGAGPLELAIDLDGLPLAMAQPFIEPVARVEVTRGTLSTRGKLALREGRVGYAGDLAVRGLSVREAQADREVLGLDELALTRLELATAPVVATLQQVRIAGLRTQMIVGPDGKTNYDGLAVPPPRTAVSARPATPASGAPEPPPRVEIGALVLEGIRADYLDRSITPPFAVKLSGLGGRITPVRWPPDRAAQLDLAGRVDAAPLSVKGTVRPAAGKQASLDLAIKLQGLDLLPASTYSAKYAGHPVSKGKLSLDLSYALSERKLEGKNMIVVDQLTLGDKVESPDATWLPVKLGLSILTDKNGRMELDLPVGGDLDDPEFGLGKIIVRALVNVLEKVATSPLALLGAVVGGGGEPPPDRVAFAPGSSALDDLGAAQLAELARVVETRPALRLSAGGTYDSASDGPELARARLTSRLLDGQRKAGNKAPQLDARAWETQLRALHASRFGARTGTTALDFAALEAQVLAGEAPSTTELAELADARARAVQAELVKALGAERVFVSAAASGPDRAVLLKLE